MFSENNRISGRQAFRLLTYDLLGLSTLLIPPSLGRTAGRDGIFCIAAGIAAGYLFLKLLGVLARDMEEPYPAYLESRLGTFPGKLAQAGYLIYFLLLAGYTAYLFTDIVRKSLVREESFYLVLGVLAVLAVYGLWGGIEGRARIYEMLFWFLMIPLFLMLFFALDEIRTDYWIPVITTDINEFLAGCYAVFACMALIVFVVFAGSYVENKRLLLLAGKRALLFTGGIHAVLYLILVGIFGAAALGEMDYPAVTLMSAVRISGGFLKRADAFMFAVWFFTLYALLNSCIFYGSGLLLQLCGIGGSMQKPKNSRCETGTERNRSTQESECDGYSIGRSGAAGGNGKREMRIATAILVGVMAVLACIFYKNAAWLSRCETVLWYIGTPFLVLVPLILGCRIFFSDGRRRKAAADGAKVIATVVFFACCFSGCHTAELEDRNFPIELAVQDTEHVAAEWMNAGQEGNRMIDYSHLKVIVFSREFIEDEAAMQEILGLFEETDEVPRNTYIVVADDPAEVLGKKEEAGDASGEGVGSGQGSEGGSGEAVGNYLEQLFENVSQIRKQAYPTLGMLYQERVNQCETLFIPYIRMEQGEPVVAQYYVWKRGTPAGIVDNQTALLAYFTGNEVKEYTMTTENGAVVSLTNAHNRIGFGEEDGRRQILVDICCDGRLKNRGGSQKTGVRASEGEGRTGDGQAGTGGGQAVTAALNVSGAGSREASAEELGEIEEQIRRYMQGQAQTVMEGRQIDLSGSYRKLGGVRRDWYVEYMERMEDYEDEMEIVYRVQIDWVSQ